MPFCIELFLYVFTYLPLRALWAVLLLVGKIITYPLQHVFPTVQNLFARQHVYILLRTFTLIIAAWSIGYLDMSRAYHYIKMLSFMRLYVIFNLLDIFDKLLTALGQDIFDSLHWATQNCPWQRKLKIFAMSIAGLIYAICHGGLTFGRMVALNVAINTKTMHC